MSYCVRAARFVVLWSGVVASSGCGMGELELGSEPTLESSESALRGGKNATPASITLNQTDPHLGDAVNFTVTGVNRARIAVACYQGGVGSMVWSADQETNTMFVFGGSDSLWKSAGGAAVCYAWLYTRSLGSGFLASTSFAAQGAR